MRRRRAVLSAGAVCWHWSWSGASSAEIRNASTALPSRLPWWSAGPPPLDPLPCRAHPPLRTHCPDHCGSSDRKRPSPTPRNGADISFTLLDRTTGRVVSGGASTVPVASVAKLFIADDLLLGTSQKRTVLSPEDRRRAGLVSRSSDDFPADGFWIRGKPERSSPGSGRHQLTEPPPAYNGGTVGR